MGEDSAPKRELGPWTLSEGIALFTNVCKATGVKAMKNSMALKIVAKENADKKNKRFEVDEEKGEVRVYDEDKV